MCFRDSLSEAFLVIRAEGTIKLNAALGGVGPDDGPERADLVDAEQKFVGRLRKMIATQASSGRGNVYELCRA